MSCEGSKRVAVIGGDGIGPEVINSALTILDAAGVEIEEVPVEIGYEKWKRTGSAMTDEDLETIKSCCCVLFGAITTPPDPNYRSVLLRLRKELDLFANIRPFSKKGLDLVIVRENTEGLYSGIEESGDDEARTVRVITRAGSKRIAKKACEIAACRRKLTIVHKANVLRSDRLFLRVCKEAAEEHGISCDDMLVDAAAYNLVLHPEKFDVMVTTNLFGDILSDEAAGVIGSLGLCASANLGERYALFEPIHGSALDIAGKGIANPVGAMRSAAMMADWLGDADRAGMIEDAVVWSLDQGVTTPDLDGSCTTRKVTDAIASHLRGNA